MNRLSDSFSKRIPLVIPAILMLIWGLLIGPIRGLVGLIVEALIVYLFFWFVVKLAGPHVLPIDHSSAAQVSVSRRLLWRFAKGASMLTAVIREGRVAPGPDGKSREHAGGSGVIDVDSTSVVVLMTGTQLSRIEGPGVAFTHSEERIGQVVDLRVQIRRQEVDLVTRDGIPIRVTVTIRFQIDKVEPVKVQEQTGVRWPRPYRWTPRTVMQARNLESVGPDGAVSWHEIPLRVAIDRLRAIVAERTFDGLSEPQDPQAHPRQDIRRRLDAEVRAALNRSGIRLIRVGIDAFFPRDFPKNYNPQSVNKKDHELGKITLQRISAWQAAWQSRMIMVDAEGTAESERRHKAAWSQAQIALILRVIQALERGAEAGPDSTDRIALRFMETLQRIAAESARRSPLSDATFLRIPTGELPSPGDEPENPPES